ncbi:LOW QUALITY PROTEIN: hypothetical protein ACHAXN_008446 [Cyclotella atomus]
MYDASTKFVRFVCDWKKRKHFDDPLSLTVKRGHPDLFKLFHNVDKRFWNDTTCVPRNEDRNEYIQPELSSELFSGDDWVDVSNYIACVIGFGEVRYKVENVRAEEIYLSAVRGHFNGKSCKSDCSSLLCHLERDSKCGFRWGREEGYSTFLEYKISLLKDSPQLVGRLEILTHVLLERPAEIDVLMTVWGYGVLRWMFEHKLVDLNSDSTSANTSFESFQIIKSIPSMRLGHFFGYANHLVVLITPARNNIFQLAVLLGRIEIIGWVHTTPVFHDLANITCSSSKLKAEYPAHIAAGQGHLEAANLLLDLGYINYQFAHYWAKKRIDDANRGRIHEEKIKRLIELVEDGSTRPLKDFILDSKCLDIDTAFKCYSFNDIGPGGFSYGDIVEKCHTFHDLAFAEWLIVFLRLNGKWRGYFWKNDTVGLARTNLFCKNDLLRIAEENDQQDVVAALSHRLVQEVSMIDPADENILYLPSLRSNP